MDSKGLVKYRCPKCGHRFCEVGEARVAGSFLAKIFDVQNRKFSTLTCRQCSYTEFFKVDSRKIGNVFDFFTG